MASIPNNWRVFHLVTSKGPNGNPANINGANTSPFDLCIPEDHNAWGPGDWDGVRLFVLPWLKLSGFNAIQISPICKNVRGNEWRGKRYAPNHSYHPAKLAPTTNSIELEPHFGDKSALVQLIQTAHSMGIFVIADIIPNHLGYDALDLLDHPEFFYNEDDLLAARLAGDKEREAVVNSELMGGLPGLRHEHWEVRRRLDLLWLYHINLHFDAYRIDALMHCSVFYQRYLRQFSPLAGYPLLGDNSYPAFGENYSGSIWFDDHHLAVGGHKAMWEMGYGSTGHPWHFCIQEECSLPGNRADVSRIAVIQKELVDNHAQSVGFIDNHDTDRAMSASLEAGNSVVAASERVHLQLVLLYGFISPPAVLYATDSLAQGYGVRALARGLETSNRVIWTPPSSSTPTLSLLRALNRARANYTSLESGWYSERYIGSGILCYIRGLDNNNPVLVIANLWDSEAHAEDLQGYIQLGDHFGESCVLRDLTGQVLPGSFSVQDGRLYGALPPRSAYLLSAV
jgi:pullulanase